MTTGSTPPKITEAQRILALVEKLRPGSPPGAGEAPPLKPGQPPPKK
jgi:hypothetical protein